MLDTHKTRMIGVSCGEKNYDNTLSRFDSKPERDGRTDRWTEKIVISVSRVSVLTRDKNRIAAVKNSILHS